MPPRYVALRQLVPQPGIPPPKPQRSFDDCSRFSCWSAAQQAGTIIGIVLAGTAILGLLLYLWLGQRKGRTPRQKRQILVRRTAEPLSQVRLDRPPLALQGSRPRVDSQSTRPRPQSPQRYFVSQHGFVYPVAARQTGINLTSGLRFESRPRSWSTPSLDPHGRNPSGRRRSEDRRRWSMEQVGGSFVGGRQGLDGVRRRMSDPGGSARHIRHSERRRGRVVENVRWVGKHRSHRNDRSKRCQGREVERNVPGQELKQEASGWLDKAIRIIKEMFKDSKWLSVLPAALSLIDTFAEPKGGWGKYHKSVNKSGNKLRLSISAREGDRRNQSRRASSSQHQERSSARPEREGRSTMYNRRYRSRRDRPSLVKDFPRDGLRISDRRRSNPSDSTRDSRSRTSRSDIGLFSSSSQRQRSKEQDIDNTYLGPAPRTRFRDTVSVTPRTVRSRVNHIPLNDVRIAGRSSRR